MTAAEWIAKRRELLAAAAAANRQHVSLPFDQREVNHMAVALEALEAVLAPHRLHEVPGGQRWCLHCGGDWPCPTVDAAETALRGES